MTVARSRAIVIYMETFTVTYRDGQDNKTVNVRLHPSMMGGDTLKEVKRTMWYAYAVKSYNIIKIVED